MVSSVSKGKMFWGRPSKSLWFKNMVLWVKRMVRDERVSEPNLRSVGIMRRIAATQITEEGGDQ